MKNSFFIDKGDIVNYNKTSNFRGGFFMYQQYDPNDIQQTKSIAWLSYFGIFFLIPMLVHKDSPYTKFHVNQGIVFLIFDVAGSIALSIVSAVLAFIPLIGWAIASLLSLAFGVLVLVFMIMGIVNAATGKAKPLPLIGKITIYK